MVGIIGWPVSGSLSPVIHNAAFSALDMDWTYVPMPVPPGSVPSALEGLRALGFAGANVTMPHKTEAARVVGERTEDAELLDAVNTIVVGSSGLFGHNTDAPGFDRFLRRDAGFEPEGRSALLFGGGGAARACALALARGGLAELTVALRDPARDAGLRATLDGSSISLSVVPFGGATSVHADLVVNATPIGGPDVEGVLPSLPHLGPDVLVIELLYDPPSTDLQRRAREAGATAFGGLGHLLEQAALSFELWTGTPAPLEVMSAAALAALAER
jgi:shikimate dehydrogenase